MQRFIGLYCFSKTWLFTSLLTINLILPINAAEAPKASETVSQDSFEAYKEVSGIKLEAAKESLQKEIEKFNERVANQDKHLDSQNDRISDVGLYLTAFGFILTFLVFIGGFLGYITVTSRAKEEARSAAQLWFEEREKHLIQQMDDFKTQIKTLQSQVQQQANQHCEAMQGVTEDVKKQAEAYMQQMEENHKSTSLNTDKTPAQPTEVDASASDALSQLAESTKQKSSNEYQFEDWRTLAFAASEKGQLEDALFYWRKASEIPSATASQIASSLFNIAYKFYELKRYQEEIATLDNLLQRFADSSDPDVQDLCAKALINKGFTLGEKLNDPQGEVATYDDLFQRFADSSVPRVQEQCAEALGSKGWALANKLNDPQGAIAIYDDLLQRFANSTIPGRQELYTKALVSKGVILGSMDNPTGSIACYNQLLEQYGQSEHSEIREICHYAEANLAETLLVLGRPTEAIPKIRQVLERADNNSEEFAIMPFLLWLAEADDTSLSEVVSAIRALSSDVKFDWNWDDIRPLMNELPEPRKTQAECCIAFFEQHHDITTLETCLADTETPKEAQHPKPSAANNTQQP